MAVMLPDGFNIGCAPGQTAKLGAASAAWLYFSVDVSADQKGNDQIGIHLRGGKAPGGRGKDAEQKKQPRDFFHLTLPAVYRHADKIWPGIPDQFPL